MKTWTISQVERVISQYNPDHDLGPDCPVTWREERLAQAILELNEDIDALQEQINELKGILDKNKGGA